jgi:hypothetical protein
MVCIGMMFTACQKEKPLSPKQQAMEKAGPENENGEDRIGKHFQKIREQATEHFTVSAEKGGTIETEDGVLIMIEGGSLTNPDGSQAHGTVEVSFLGNFERGTQAFFNMPAETAVSADGTGDTPLKTGGSFDLRIKNEEGQDLSAPDGGVQVVIPADLTDPDGVADPEMRFWKGEEGGDQNRDNGWVEQEIPVQVVQNRYIVTNFPPGFGICNIDRSVNWGLPTTPITADIQGPWDENNAEIFVAFADPLLQGTLASMDMYNSGTGQWGEHGGMLNEYQEVYLIAIGYDANDQLHYKIQHIPAASPGGHFELITGMAPAVDMQEVIDAINAL